MDEKNKPLAVGEMTEEAEVELNDGKGGDDDGGK